MYAQKPYCWRKNKSSADYVARKLRESGRNAIVEPDAKDGFNVIIVRNY